MREFSSVEWHFAVWISPAADDDGQVTEFFQKELGRLERSHGCCVEDYVSPIGKRSPIPSAPCLTSVEGERWLGHQVHARPFSSVSSREIQTFGRAELRRFVKSANAMNPWPLGAAVVMAAWVGSDEIKNFTLSNGRLGGFEPEALLLTEEGGAWNIRPLSDALNERLRPLIRVRSATKALGNHVVPLKFDIAQLVSEITRQALEKIPQWSAYSRAVRIDTRLPEVAPVASSKPRF